MHFKENFEKSMNDHMHEDDGQPGRAPSEAEDADMNLKKKGFPTPQLDVEDQELNEKKDRPPRFSTLFGAAPAPATPPREYVREYYPEPKRKSGVFMPMPLFILFAAILFFESTILFAYTVIGLYNNAPSRIFPWAGPGTTTVTACDSKPAGSINFAPNFIIPGQQGQGEVTQVVTITPTATTSSTTGTTSSINTAAAVTDIAGILGGLASTPSKSIAIVTVAPERSTATSIKLITEDASGNVVSAQPTPTVTKTTFVDPPASTKTDA